MSSFKKFLASWVNIVFWFIFFFPLGFVFLYIRWEEEKGKFYAKTKLLFWLGLVIGAFGILSLFISISEEDFLETFVIDLCFFIVPGAICLYSSYKKNKKLKIYDKYMAYISTRKKIKIDGLCKNVNDNYENVTRTVEEMICNGIVNGYLDDEELILNKFKNDDVQIDIQNDGKKVETKIVKCRECGAKNTVIVGQQKECEYCGTILR